MATSSCVRLADAKPFAKFFRMLRVGLPEHAVRQAMRAEGVDERVLSLGGDALVSDLPSIASPPKPCGPQIDDRVYRKSLRMLLVGVPPAAVEASMQRALDTTAYDQTLGKLKAALARRSAAALGPWEATMPKKMIPTLDQSPTLAATKFVKMERVGVPTGAVQQAQQLALAKVTADTVGDSPSDGLSMTAPSWTRLFLLVSTAPQNPPQDSVEKPLYDHAAVGRFFKMLRAGVPEDAVKTALARAGLPQELVDWDPAMPVSRLVANYQAPREPYSPATQ